jgi:RND family efflux transporter MFP subunit
MKLPVFAIAYRPFLCVLTASLALSGCKKEAEVAAVTPALKVQLVQPQATQVAQTVRATGTVHAREEVQLGVELNGVRVESVLVEVGDRVTAGQVLLRLDTRLLQAELNQVRASVKQAQAQLQVASKDATRGAELRKRGLVSARDSEQTEAALINARAGLELAQAQLQRAELQLSFATLRAPFAGTISARDVQPGVLASPAMSLLRLIKNDELEWRAELAEADFVRVSKTQTVLLGDGNAPAISAEIRALAPGLDLKNRTGLIYASIPTDAANAAGVKAGVFIPGTIQLGAAAGNTIPSTAIVRRDGYDYVFVVENNVVKLTKVTLGVNEASGVQLLAPADLKDIVKEGAGFLSDGDRVAVIAASTPR